MRYVLAANRDIGVRVLGHLLDEGLSPEALMLQGSEDASTIALAELACLPNELVFRGPPGQIPGLLPALRMIRPDFIISIHYPYIVEQELIEIPRVGFLNLHPALLPYNRGWHTPSWSILDETPAGATFHFLDEGVDTGDIISQKQVNVSISDTAHSLYQRILDAEFELFCESLPSLRTGVVKATAQVGEGTSHKKSDLRHDEIARLNLDEQYLLRDLLKRLRALTTNNRSEACYFVENGTHFRITVSIEPDY